MVGNVLLSFCVMNNPDVSKLSVVQCWPCLGREDCCLVVLDCVVLVSADRTSDCADELMIGCPLVDPGGDVWSIVQRAYVASPHVCISLLDAKG